MSRAKPRRPKHLVCVSNDGLPASFEPRKIYRTLPDPKAEAHGLLRVIDESGEDYLFAAGRFEAIEVGPALARKMRLAG